MIKKLFILLCLCVLCIGSAWGDTYTCQFSTKGWAVTGDNPSWTSGKEGNQFTSGQGIQVTEAATGANGTSPISFTNVSKVVVKYCTNASKGAGTIKVQVGSGTEKTFSVTKPSSGGTTLKDAEFTFSPTETGNIKITAECTTNSVYIYGVTITYDGTTPSKTLESIAVKTAPTKTTYNVGETFEPAGLAITATYDTGDPEDIAYEGNESKFTFSPSLETALTKDNNKVTITYGEKTVDQAITVNLNKLATPVNLEATPTATSATLTWDEVANASKYEVNVTDASTYDETFYPETNSLLVEGLTANTEYLWSVKAIGDKTKYADSDESAASEFTTFALPTVAYTVSFDGNEHGTPANESITEASAGAGVTLPNCTPNEGYQFVGWATTNTATEADAGEAGATYYPTANITLYAVYNQVFTINYMVNGVNTGAQENVVKGTALVFPEVSAPDADHVFCGWVEEAITEPQATAPEYVTTEGLTATQDITYYAVFAEKSGSEPVEEKTQTLQYDTWTYSGSTTDKDSYRLFHKDSYIESAEFDLSKLSKVIVYGGTFGGASYNSLTIGDGTNTWKSVTVSGSSQTGTNTYTDGTALSGTGKLRITSNSGSASSNGVRISKVEIFTMEGGITYSNWCTTVVTKTLTSISLSGNYPTEFWKGETFSHEGMTVTAHYNDESTKNVTTSATFTGYDMATAGEQTVTVSYETASTTYDITVKAIANTAATAYTVAEAIALIDANPTELSTTDVYVKGTVSEIVTPWNDSFKNITYNISDDGETTSSQFQLYRCVTNGAVAGDYVIGYGKIKKYVKSGNPDVYEFDAGNSIVNTANMTITAAKWGTFCAPFNVTIPDGIKAYKTDASGSEVTFTEVTTTIPAGTPVVVYSDIEVDKNYFGALAEEETCTSGALVGVYAATSGIPAIENGNQNYVLQNQEGKVGFYKANKNISLKANRCYMTLPATSGAKESILFDEVVTGINTILNNKDKSVEGIFDLNGRRLSAPRKGVNIINGVKVIVK